MAEPSGATRAIHVVAAILIQAGRICITRRREDVHQAGKWEFPGGKLEPQEDSLSGLKRELNEELGIEVLEASPFVRLSHRYAELDVLLDVWRVHSYRGSPHGRESQELRWANVQELQPEHFPAADRPVLRRLQLPALYLISDVRRFGEEEFVARLERALRAGARLVQLREPDMSGESFCAYARRVAQLCHHFGARLLINADPAWLPQTDADGVHLNSRRLLARSERPVPQGYWLAASCHDAAELQQAQALGVDFAVLGPVQPTASHPGGAVLGWDRFAVLRASTALPLYAIGGMSGDDLGRARALGAQGLAMISGLWGREDFETVVARLSELAT